MLCVIDPVEAMFSWQGKQLHQPWQDLSHCVTLQSAVEQVAEIYEFQLHPYFLWMRGVGLDERRFVRSQVPFQYAIEAFAQAYGVIFDRSESLACVEVPSAGTVMSPSRQAFQVCLQRLSPRVNLAEDCPAAIVAANRQLLNYCLTQPLASGAAVLGMIEYLYVDVSATIAQIVVQRNWADGNSDFYYLIHESLGINPDQDLLTLAQPSWSDPTARSQTAQSLLLGAQYLWDLYDAIYPG
ncbi:MAG: hypothetical protein RLZZ511_1896 [Cyanobacteriota bacterium]|jgi:pyrroloquinoline-quinone synthase